MSRTEMLFILAVGSYPFTLTLVGAAFKFLWDRLDRLSRAVHNHHRHELDELKDRVEELERGQRKDPE